MADQPPRPIRTLPPDNSYPYFNDLTGLPKLPQFVSFLGPPSPKIPTEPGLHPPRLTLPPADPLSCCEFPRRDPTDPNRAPTTPPRKLSSPLPFPPLPTTRRPLRVTFSCGHTAPPSVLPVFYSQPQLSTTLPLQLPPPNPPPTLPHPCRECALTLMQTAQNGVHRAHDPAIAALEAQIADARRELWVGGGRRAVGTADPLMLAYERAHGRLRVLLRERAEALWRGRSGWEAVWGKWEGVEEGNGE
ncbi:hypothetical protein MMC11_001879 [Xylographa trunciseda]|nr:hypothetical protein [Xylographa trunciseda]